MPNIEDLYDKLSGGQIFSKLDLSHAYQQLLLDEDSQKLTTINTTKGLYQYTRMPFGISAAPGKFQRTIEQVLYGIPGVVVYLDDILVSGRNKKEHHSNLTQVLDRLHEAGFWLKREKCIFNQLSCEYLGHILD